MAVPFPESRRFSIRLTRPVGMFLATVVMVIVAVGLQIGVPVYRQQVAMP